jgi:beta-carotene 3-hydroxylase
MLNISLVIIAYFFMEFVAWSNHKYVMHGFLWRWHKDHHVNDQYKVSLDKMATSNFEKNDLFFLVYAIPAIILMIIGLSVNMLPLVFIGIGITLYGFTYFMIHDILIHQRLRIPFLFKKPGFYTNAIINAHLAHHRPKSADDFRNFGLLIFPLRFFKK